MFHRDTTQINKVKNLTLKPLRFNVIQRGMENIKLYNSFTGRIVKFTREDTNDLLHTLRSKEISYSETNRLVDFLVDKKFLINSDIDEFRKATAQKVSSLSEDRTLNLIIMPNEDCNFRCVYCYEDFEKSEMNEKTITGIINYVKNNIHKYEALVVSWFGGEPLISFNVIQKLSKELIEICDSKGVEYMAGITTNGYNLTTEVFTELLRYKVLGYQITLDGTKETHDQFRVGKNGEETFDTIVLNLMNIRDMFEENNFQIMIRSNISEETFPVMYEYIDYISKEFAADERFQMHFVSVKNLKGEQSGDIHLCDTKELFPFYTQAQDKGFDFSFYKQTLQPGGSECYAALPGSFVIGSDGMVYKCTVAFNNSLNHVGNIYEDGEMEIYEDRLFLWLSGGANEDSACTSCYFRPSCQGNACPLERIEANKTPCPPVKRNIKRYLDIIEEDLVYEG
ncbi:radical SAM/SPASM domain-containing protein [Virgibacillus pantothenticus]|nr:radical SAM/SPASM domain-containing protein [Virgibacillus pantothenticus]